MLVPLVQARECGDRDAAPMTMIHPSVECVPGLEDWDRTALNQRKLGVLSVRLRNRELRAAVMSTASPSLLALTREPWAWSIPPISASASLEFFRLDIDLFRIRNNRNNKI